MPGDQFELGPCPGYVIDHVRPLKRGGADATSNMQWQMTAAARAKDRGVTLPPAPMWPPLPFARVDAALKLYIVDPWGDDSAYFPLEVGNCGYMKRSGTRCCTPVIIEVVDSADFNDNTHFLLWGFPRAQGDYWVRINDDGSLVAYDFDQNQEILWYAFQAPEGQTFETALPFGIGLGSGCRPKRQLPRANRRDRQTRSRWGIRECSKSASVEIFVPDIGLVRRTENTGGPSAGAYELVYARIGGVTIRSDELNQIYPCTNIGRPATKASSRMRDPKTLTSVTRLAARQIVSKRFKLFHFWHLSSVRLAVHGFCGDSWRKGLAGRSATSTLVDRSSVNLLKLDFGIFRRVRSALACRTGARASFIR